MPFQSLIEFVEAFRNFANRSCALPRRMRIAIQYIYSPPHTYTYDTIISILFEELRVL